MLGNRRLVGGDSRIRAGLEVNSIPVVCKEGGWGTGQALKFKGSRKNR